MQTEIKQCKRFCNHVNFYEGTQREELDQLCSEDVIKIKENLGMVPKLSELFASFFNNDFDRGGKVRMVNVYLIMEMPVVTTMMEVELKQPNALQWEWWGRHDTK